MLSSTLDITRTGNNPQNTKLLLFHPKPQEIYPKLQEPVPAALQMYFTPLRVHISHSYNSHLVLLFFVFYFPTLWILSHWKMPECAPGMTWGRGKKQSSLPCLNFQHCWSADPDCYLLNNNHFPPLTLSVNSTSLPRSLGYYQQLFPFIRHFCNSRGSPEVQACGFQMVFSRPWAHSNQVLGWSLTHKEHYSPVLWAGNVSKQDYLGGSGRKGFHGQLESRWWPQLEVTVFQKVLRFYNYIFVWSYVFPLVFLRKGAASHDIIRPAASLFKVLLCWLHIPQPLHYGSCLSSPERSLLGS